MALRVITFDWGDTLAVNHGMPYRRIQRAALARLGADLRACGGQLPENWLDTCLAELDTMWVSTVDPRLNPDLREMDFAGMLGRWVATTGALEADAAQVRLAIDRCLASQTDAVSPYAEVPGVLALLRARGWRMGIISHVCWPGAACRAWFQRHHLAGYFDFYSFSSDAGYIKPSPHHYRHALDQAGCQPHEVLHVGDHPHRDVEGARRHGMRTVLRLTEGIYPDADLERCQPDATIINLRELPQVIERLRA